MKKLLWGIVVLVVLLVAAVFVGPGFVDWNNYKSEIAGYVKGATGRDLNIGGDIRITVFPAPAVVANDVTLSNVPGATASEMIRLKSAEVRMALAPLLAGRVKVETVKLVEPVVNLEVLPDGVKNWEIQAETKDGSTSTGGGSSVPAAADTSTAPAVVLDNFTIENGAVVFADQVNGLTERIEAINAEVAAASLQGPFQLTGSVNARGIPLTYDINVGEIIQGRTLTLNVRAGISPDLAKVQINGTVLGLPDDPRFKGSVRGNGNDLAAALSGAGVSGLPPLLAQPFSLEGQIQGSARGGEINELTMALADSKAVGDVAVELAEEMEFSVKLAANKFNFDAWLARVEQGAGKHGTPAGKSAGRENAKIPGNDEPEAAGFAIPDNLAGSVIVSIDSVQYRDGLIRDLLVNADVAGGRVTLSQASAQFPGASDFFLAGELSTDEGAPRFAGEVESSVNDLRGVLSWLGAELPDVPSDRLRRLDLKTQISATHEQVQVSGLELGFDSSRLTGAATIALRKRPSFGVNVTLDRIDLDAYLPRQGQTAKPKSASQQGSHGAGTAQGDKQPAKPASPLRGLAALGAFDANIQARAKTLVVHGEQVKNAAVDATLYNGGLEIRRLAVGHFAGMNAGVTGKLTDLAGAPKARGLNIKAGAKNLGPFLRFVAPGLGLDAKKLGPFSISTTIDGNLLKPEVSSLTKIAGASVQTSGQVSVLPVGDMFDLDIKAEHADLAKLARAFGSAYRPSGRIGGLTLSMRAKGGPGAVDLSGIAGKIGTITVGGDARVGLAGQKPNIKANLRTGAIQIDPYLPASQGTDLRIDPWGGVRIQPVALSGPRLDRQNPVFNPSAVSPRWSSGFIDLSALRTVDADITLNSPVIIFGKYLVEKADIAATIQNGVLNANRIKANIFGGALDAVVSAAAGQKNRISSKVNVSGINIANALKSVIGEASANGKLGVNLDLGASGNSVAGLISSLGGTGAFDMRDVDVRKKASGSIFAGIYDILSTLNRFGAGKSNEKANVSGSFDVKNGVAQTDNLKLTSGYGNGVAGGVINLPQWTMDIEGQVELTQNILTQKLQSKIKNLKSSVPVGLSGPIDNPKVKFDPFALIGSSVPIPGADLLLNKLPKGAGSIVKGILGGGQQQPSSPPPAGNTSRGGDAPPPPKNSGRQQQPVINPADLLKGLFK